VLAVVCQVAAPLLPLTTDEVFAGLGHAGSVHLTDWPDSTAFPEDTSLVTAMESVRSVCSAASALRKSSGHRVRQPLPSLTVVAADADDLRPFTDIIADELNVKAVELSTDVASAGTFHLSVNPRVLGPRLGQQVQQVIGAAKRGDWRRTDDSVIVGGVTLSPGEFELTLVGEGPGHAAALPGNRGLVSLDTTVTPELRAEGVARDLVRLVQQARRDAGLHVADRIRLTLGLSAALEEMVAPFVDVITAPTLAVELVFDAREANAELDGHSIYVGVERVPV
jgi:isoleucyl-tRNA synthetase